MTDFFVGSDHTRALDHFAGYGLSAILEQAGERDVRLHWSDEAVPKLILSGLRSTPTAVADAVHAHAVAHYAADSWVQQLATVQRADKPHEVGLFSPRIAAPQGTDAWNELYAKRFHALDASTN